MEITKAYSTQSCEQEVKNRNSPVFVTPWFWILKVDSYEIVSRSLSFHNRNVIRDITVNIKCYPHIPGDTENLEYESDDLYKEVHNDLIVDIVKIHVNVILKFLISQYPV